MNNAKSNTIMTAIIMLSITLGIAVTLIHNEFQPSDNWYVDYHQCEPPLGYKWADCANVSKENRADQGQILLVPECLLTGDTVHYECHTGKAHSFMLTN